MFSRADKLLHSAQYACCTGREIEFEPTLTLLIQVAVIHGKVGYAIIIEAHTAELHIICVEDILVSALAHHEAIVSIRACGAEVEEEEQVAAFVGQYLVTIVVPDFAHLETLDGTLFLQSLEHGGIKVAQIVIAKLLVVHQIPLTTGILLAPSVTFAGEVNPFGMSELIAHEVEITAIDGT